MTTTGAGAKLAPNQVAPSATAVPTLLAGLDNGAIADIIAAGVLRRFPAGQLIVHADDPGTHLFLIKTGIVDLHRVTPKGQQVLIIRFSSGDAFGIVSIPARPMGYLGTAEAVGKTEIYVWDHRSARHFTQKYPTFADNAMRIGLEYIKLYSDRHLALVADDAESRLRRTLSQLELRAGHMDHARGLEVEITNERLASLADIGQFTVSRLLNKWKRKGALVKTRSKVVILHPEGMLDPEPPHQMYKLNA
jgi:CRP-like cAMP-binding protein